MHILFIITKGDNIGGAQVYVRDLAFEFQKKGYQVSVTVGTLGDLSKALEEKGITVFHLAELKVPISPFNDLLVIFKIRSLIKKIGPDIVSLNSSKVGIVGRLACFLSNIPSVFTVHGWAFTEGVGSTKTIFFKFFEWLLKPFSTAWIVVSDYDYLLGKKAGVIDEKKTFLVHNGIKERMAVKKAAGVNEKMRIIMIARHDEQKDHLTLFRAVSELEDIEVFLLGDGPLLESNKHLASSLGIANKLKFLGYKRDIGQYLQDADIFALISNWEGFPLSTLEAMSYKLPVIVSDVGGAPEAVIPGKSGFVVARKDVAGLVACFRKLQVDVHLRRSMGNAGYNFFVERFTLEQAFLKTNEIFKSLIENSDRH